MATVKFHTFDGGLVSGATRFLTPANELRRSINLTQKKIGGLSKRLGYAIFGDTIQASSAVRGLYGYYRLNGDAYLLATTAGGRLSRTTGGAVTQISAGMLASAKHEFATFIDEVFICGYNETARTFDTVQNLDNTTLTSTNNLTGANNAKIPIVFRQRLYLISLSGRRSAFQYSAAPTGSGTAITWPSTNIEEVRTDDGDELVGAAEIANRLVLFKQNSLHEWNESSISQVGKIGTTSHKSIVNSGQFLFYFSRSQNVKGFYVYGGGQPKLISSKIQDWCDGIGNTGLADIVGWKQGNDIIWYVGTITLGSETFSNSCIVYNLISNTWGVYQLDDAVTSASNFIVSSVERPYIGVSDGDVHQMAISGDTVYSDNGTAIAALGRTSEYALGSEEEMKKIANSIWFSEQAQGLQVRVRANGGDWKEIGQLTKTVNEFPVNTKGHYFEFEFSESSADPPFTFTGFSISASLDSKFD